MVEVWAKRLGYAGLIPFVAAAIAAWAGITVPFDIDPVFAGQAYGAVILSFLGGIRWGAALSGNHEDDWLNVAFSVIPSIVGWLSLLLPPFFGLPLLLIGFAVQLQWDMSARKKGIIPSWFMGLRMQLTTGAILSLAALLPLAG